MTLGIPKVRPKGEYGCRVTISGLPDRVRESRVIFGADGMQSLQLALWYMRSQLMRSRVARSLGPSALGFPPIVPMHLPDRYQHSIERAIRGEELRWDRECRKLIELHEGKGRRRARSKAAV
ncbi:MAG: hypothetical protein MUE84_05470 [Hyphomonas sp.]|nr:hypothetical protein [Hyphomonas sp.]